MKAIEVIVDIKTSPDEPELVVVKQRLAAEGGELRLIGEPVETRLPLTARLVRGDPRFDLKRVKVGRLASTAIDQLAEHERFRLIEEVNALAALPPNQWPEEKLLLLEGDSPGYLLNGPLDLRIFLKPIEPEGVEILDIVREETLRHFMENGEPVEATG